MGNIATLDPPMSPLLWTSIATGKTADLHGIHGFAEPDPATGGRLPMGMARELYLHVEAGTPVEITGNSVTQPVAQDAATPAGVHLAQD